MSTLLRPACTNKSLRWVEMQRCCEKKVTMKLPLGLEELYDWPSPLLRAAGCVHKKVCGR